MALFVFGAGATRGCSFVKPEEEPCLPPLDGDFFTQLQKVSNPKNRNLVNSVIKDVVELFGNNFEVTMETVFTTLEHTARMLKTTGESRDFKRKDLELKKLRLMQAIAVVFEDSLTEKSGGRPSVIHKKCDYHGKFVGDFLKAKDSLISFNYDCVLDNALKDRGSEKWNARFGYCFNLGSHGSKLTGDEHWQPSVKATKAETVKLYKLHGSLHFRPVERGSRMKLKQRPYTRMGRDLKFAIIPPETFKDYGQPVFNRIWEKAASSIHRAEHIVVIGYSLPQTDSHTTALFRTSVRKKSLKTLIVVNPDKKARQRTRSVLLRGITEHTRVLSFDKFEHFLALPRNSWEL